MTAPVLMEGNRIPIYFNVPEPRMPLTAAEKLEEAIRTYGPQDGPDVLSQIPGLFEGEIVNGVTFPHESLSELSQAYSSGCAEPWTAQLVTSLLVASNHRDVLEIGSFTGYTSAWLALALERMGGGTFTAVDIDPERAHMARARLDTFGFEKVKTHVIVDDSLHFIPTLPNRSIGFAWIDGNHEKFHVEREINLLWPKMKVNGILAFHDVIGRFDLQSVVRKYGGIAIDLPKLGACGGVGLLQVQQ